MKKVLVFALAACMVCAASAAFARSLGLPNELLNGGFENGVVGWSGSGWSVIGPGWFWGAGPYTGAKGLGVAANGGISEAEITQIVPVAAPGVYQVDLSGWVWIFDNSDNPYDQSWATVQITADGEVVAEKTLYSTENPRGQWIYVELTWQGYVEAFKDVHIVGHADGRIDGWWGVIATDDWDLEERLVPEPSSLIALLTGAAALGGLALRRR